MKTTIINKTLVAMLAFSSCLFTACVEDEGNYNYKQLDEITVEGISDKPIEVLSRVDHIKISPKFYANGKAITPGDPNYTVRYRFGHAGMGSMGIDEETNTSIAWKEFIPKDDYSIDEYADFGTGAYLIWLTVTDNRTGAVTSKQYNVNIGSTTYEGWLVLCNEGDDNRARLDMISKISSDRIETIHDICKGLPLLHNATGINAFPQGSNPGDQVHIFTKEGAYEIDSESLAYDGNGTFEDNHFAFAPVGHIIKEDMFSPVPSVYSWQQKYKLCFDDQDNVYIFADGTFGAAYSMPINTTAEGTDIEFKVAPYMGVNLTRPWSAGANILLYDKTNKRFVMYAGNSEDRLQLTTIPDPSGEAINLFSYTTGKDLLFMQSCYRSNGLVYSVLQDAEGNRSIYGINMGGATPVQELYIDKVEATNFNQATQFAFDPRWPFLYYAVGNKVYCYNLATKNVAEMQTGLAAGDEIVKLKFNLFRAVNFEEFIDKTPEFLNKQYQLIVCTYNESEGKDGGKVSFFNVDTTNGVLSADKQYTGFAKIADIIYRERTE